MFQIHQTLFKYTKHVSNTPVQVLPNTVIKLSNTLLDFQLISIIRKHMLTKLCFLSQNHSFCFKKHVMISSVWLFSLHAWYPIVVSLIVHWITRASYQSIKIFIHYLICFLSNMNYRGVSVFRKWLSVFGKNGWVYLAKMVECICYNKIYHLNCIII